jgi:hypothetical protein
MKRKRPTAVMLNILRTGRRPKELWHLQNLRDIGFEEVVKDNPFFLNATEANGGRRQHAQNDRIYQFHDSRACSVVAGSIFPKGFAKETLQALSFLRRFKDSMRKRRGVTVKQSYSSTEATSC